MPNNEVKKVSGEVALYDAKVPAKFGNSVLSALIAQAGMEAEAQHLQETAQATKGLIAFEMTKAVLDLAEKFPDKINLFQVFEGGKAVEKLNTAVLTAFGVIKREIDGEDIVVRWTDENVQKLYDYNAELKKENEAEFDRRFNNRKRLNFRLSEAYKAACTLQTAAVTADKLVIEQGDNGPVGTINGGPKEMLGEAKKITLGFKTPQTGASHSPTMASLVKLAVDKHKKDEEKSLERSDKGNDRSGEAKLGMSDEEFGKMVNNLKMAIKAQEGKLSANMIKQINSLKPVLEAASPTVKKEDKKA